VGYIPFLLFEFATSPRNTTSLARTLHRAGFVIRQN
jgi:hypothetical protein